MSGTRVRVNLNFIVNWSFQRTPCLKQARYLNFNWIFLDIQPAIECRFTLKHVHDMIITYSQMQFIDEYSQHNSIIWLVLLNVRVFVYELCGYGFESRCCHINTFSAQLLFRRSLLSKINNYSEYVLFRSKYFCQTVTFSEELF